MKKTNLQKLKEIKREIEIIDLQISNTNLKYYADKVKGSGAEFPYIEQNFNIYGVGYDEKLKKLIEKQQKKKEQLKNEYEKTLQFIDDIEDGIIKQILFMRYVELLKWSEIADNLNYSEKHIRRKHNDFFEKMSNNVRF